MLLQSLNGELAARAAVNSPNIEDFLNLEMANRFLIHTRLRPAALAFAHRLLAASAIFLRAAAESRRWPLRPFIAYASRTGKHGRHFTERS